MNEALEKQYKFYLRFEEDDSRNMIRVVKDCGCIEYFIEYFCESVVDYVTEMDEKALCPFHINEERKNLLAKMKFCLANAEDRISDLRKWIPEQKERIQRQEKEIEKFEKLQ